MSWFRRKKAPDSKSTDEQAVPRKSDHGAMYYFALFSRIFTPLAILGWLCWMPSPNRSLPKNWDPGCPELTGTWVECELDPSKPTQVMSKLWPLDAKRLLQVEKAMHPGAQKKLQFESRIAILDTSTGARLKEASWQPGCTNFWPGLGLSSTHHDQANGKVQLTIWDVETLQPQVLILPSTHWDRQFGLSSRTEAHFRPRKPDGWQMLSSFEDSEGKQRLKGLILDAQGNVQETAWISEQTPELRMLHEFIGGSFTPVLEYEAGYFIPVPVDPDGGWPDVSKISNLDRSYPWKSAPRFGHIGVNLRTGSFSPQELNWASPLRVHVTAPLAATDCPMPKGGPLHQASYLLGHARTWVWRLLYDEDKVRDGLMQSLRLEEVRLVNPDRKIDCPLDQETLRALRRQSWRGWELKQRGKPSGPRDLRLPLENGVSLHMPLKSIPLSANRLLLLHYVDDAPDNRVEPAGRIRIGLVEGIAVKWLGWCNNPVRHPSHLTNNFQIARYGDLLMLIREGMRWNGGDLAYSIPSAWITLPLPAELADLPEGPLQ